MKKLLKGIAKIPSQIMKFIKAIPKFIAKIADDVLLIIGAGFLCYGIYLIYIPAGIITIGLCFIAFAYCFAKRK